MPKNWPVVALAHTTSCRWIRNDDAGIQRVDGFLDQDAVARLRLHHPAFEFILSAAVASLEDREAVRDASAAKFHREGLPLFRHEAQLHSANLLSFEQPDELGLHAVRVFRVDVLGELE